MGNIEACGYATRRGILLHLYVAAQWTTDCLAKIFFHKLLILLPPGNLLHGSVCRSMAVGIGPVTSCSLTTNFVTSEAMIATIQPQVLDKVTSVQQSIARAADALCLSKELGEFFESLLQAQESLFELQNLLLKLKDTDQTTSQSLLKAIPRAIKVLVHVGITYDVATLQQFHKIWLRLGDKCI